MKKSDLARRADNDAERAYKKAALYLPDEQEAHAEGFQSGYRAARADLRRAWREAQILVRDNPNAAFDVFETWLRPIR